MLIILFVLIAQSVRTNKSEPKTIKLNPNFKLYYDKNVPLTRYPYIQRVFLAGSNKWPQRGWAPGDKGFPNKKAGNSSNP